MVDVWDEFMAMQRRMDDLFRTYLGPRARTTFPALPEGFLRPFVPVCDVFGREGDLVVHLEVPGIDPEKDVTIRVEDDVLVIRGERSTKEEVEEKDFYRMESSYGSFERRLGLRRLRAGENEPSSENQPTHRRSQPLHGTFPLF